MDWVLMIAGAVLLIGIAFDVHSFFRALKLCVVDLSQASTGLVMHTFFRMWIYLAAAVYTIEAAF